MNKQIEEMAKIIVTGCNEGCCEECKHSEGVLYPDCVPQFTAEALYNAGYRKQSEGEWKKRGNEKTCSLCKFIYYSNNDDWNYCPNCGSKMKGGAE